MKKNLEFYFKLLLWLWLIVPFHISMLMYAVIDAGEKFGRGMFGWIAIPYLLSILWMLFAFVFLLLNGNNKIGISLKQNRLFSWQIVICYFCVLLSVLFYFTNSN